MKMKFFMTNSAIAVKAIGRTMYVVWHFIFLHFYSLLSLYFNFRYILIIRQASKGVFFL